MKKYFSLSLLASVLMAQSVQSMEEESQGLNLQQLQRAINNQFAEKNALTKLKINFYKP